MSKATKQQKFSPNEPGGRANVFFVFKVTLLLLRQRYVFRPDLRYVTVAGVRFSCTLRYRSGREAHRGSRF
jgi:hypothetical protein